MATPQAGDVGFVQIAGGAGLGIRIAQWLNGNGFRNYQHAFTVVVAPNGIDPDYGYLVEAEPGGARRESLDEYLGTDVEYLTLSSLTGAQRLAMATLAESLVGTPYSFIDYLAIALHRFHLPSKRLEDYISSTKHMICSQMADYVLQGGDYHAFNDERLPGYVTPLALREQLLKNGWTVVT